MRLAVPKRLSLPKRLHMLKRVAVFSPMLALAAASSAAAQGRPAGPPPSPVADEAAALARLDFMLGTWTGSGWIQMGPDRRAQFTQTEIVSKKLEGALLTIDGDGRDAANAERHIHSAFATITYSPETKAFKFMPFSGGHMLDVTPTISDKVFVWGYDAPYGKTRFTLDFTSGQWHETGELSRDGGQTWMKNFEMTLTRSKD